MSLCGFLPRRRRKLVDDSALLRRGLDRVSSAAGRAKMKDVVRVTSNRLAHGPCCLIISAS